LNGSYQIFIAKLTVDSLATPVSLAPKTDFQFIMEIPESILRPRQGLIFEIGATRSFAGCVLISGTAQPRDMKFGDAWLARTTVLNDSRINCLCLSPSPSRRWVITFEGGNSWGVDVSNTLYVSFWCVHLTLLGLLETQERHCQSQSQISSNKLRKNIFFSVTLQGIGNTLDLDLHRTGLGSNRLDYWILTVTSQGYRPSTSITQKERELSTIHIYSR
jgi:hypothetical protein